LELEAVVPRAFDGASRCRETSRRQLGRALDVGASILGATRNTRRFIEAVVRFDRRRGGCANVLPRGCARGRRQHRRAFAERRAERERVR